MVPPTQNKKAIFNSSPIYALAPAFHPFLGGFKLVLISFEDAHSYLNWKFAWQYLCFFHMMQATYYFTSSYDLRLSCAVYVDFHAEFWVDWMLILGKLPPAQTLSVLSPHLPWSLFPPTASGGGACKRVPLELGFGLCWLGALGAVSWVCFLGVSSCCSLLHLCRS